MEAKAADFRDRKISVSQARKILGGQAKSYSDDELRDILDCLYQVAEFGLRLEMGFCLAPTLCTNF